MKNDPHADPLFLSFCWIIIILFGWLIVSFFLSKLMMVQGVRLWGSRLLMMLSVCGEKAFLL